MSELKRTVMQFNEKDFEHMAIIKDVTGMDTMIASVRYALFETANRLLRNEKRVYKAGSDDQKISLEEQRMTREVDRCKSIAKKLDGKLIPNGDTFDVEYYTHSKHGSARQKLPLLSMTEDLIAKQYFPSREAVDAYRLKHKD